MAGGAGLLSLDRKGSLGRKRLRNTDLDKSEMDEPRKSATVFAALKEKVLQFLKNKPKCSKSLKLNPGIMIYSSFVISLFI